MLEASVVTVFFPLLLFRVVYKHSQLRLRLDQILGKQGSKNKDVYASKISLASRVVKVERQVSFYLIILINLDLI